MANTFRKILFLFFLGLSLSGNALGSSKLIELFCFDYVLFSQAGVSIGQNIQLRDSLFEQLKKRQNVTQQTVDSWQKVLSQPEWQSCLSRFQGEFQVAEIALGGMEFLQRQQIQQTEQPSTVPSVAVRTQLSNELVGSIEITSASTQKADARLQTTTRKQQYEKLWERFKRRLKRKLSSQASAS